MNISSLRRWLWGGASLRNRLGRIRYFRGHGVHSPFVYDLVRQVFMLRSLMPGDRKLYEALLAAGYRRLWAMQLQNLAIHCRYECFGWNKAEGDWSILTSEISLEEADGIVREAAESGRTVVVMTPYANQERLDMCRKWIARHRSTTVDKMGYLLIFNNYLPKQHFRI